MARAVGAISVVDGVAYAPHGLPDVAALGADVYLFSLYKTWGPHQGLMTVRRELMERLPNQSHFFNDGAVRKRLVPAGPDHAQVAASAGIADYLDAVYEHHWDDSPSAAERGRRLHELFRQHEATLIEPLLAFLSDRADVRLLGPTASESKAPTVSLLPLRKSVSDVYDALTAQRIMAGSGNFYGVRPLTAMDVPLDPGVIRLSFLHYTSPAEIDAARGGSRSRSPTEPPGPDLAEPLRNSAKQGRPFQASCGCYCRFKLATNRPARSPSSLAGSDLRRTSMTLANRRSTGRTALALLALSLLAVTGAWAQGSAWDYEPDEKNQIIPPDALVGFDFQSLGFSRGGRSTAVSGVLGDPLTYYFGGTGGGVWKTSRRRQQLDQRHRRLHGRRRDRRDRRRRL